MAQSLNKTVEFHTTGVSYLGVGGKVGKMLLGNAAFEFYADTNVENYIQIPWAEGKILKIAREKLGNDKVVKLPTLLQTIGQKIKNLFAKK